MPHGINGYLVTPLNQPPPEFLGIFLNPPATGDVLDHQKGNFKFASFHQQSSLF
jgi:hypothetical protein